MWSQRDVEPERAPWPMPSPTSAPGQSRVPALYTTSLLTCLLAAVFVGTRFYVYKRFKLPLGRDFWTIVAAGIFCWTAGGIGIWAGTLGLGKHSRDISRSDHLKLNNVIIVLPTMNNVAALSVQCSVLFFYLKRLSMPKCQRVATYIIGIISALFCLVRVVGNTYHCKVGKCVKVHSMWYALGVIAMALDLAIWSLPIPPLLRSASAGKMSPGVRIGVLATLGVGLLACIMTVARIVAIKAVTENMDDMSWNASLVFIFEQLEVGLGIVAACMPSLRRLVGIKSPSDDQPRQISIEVLPGHDMHMLKENTGDIKDMWSDTTPPPPPPRIGGAIHFGPRGHLDLDIEGLGVLDSRLSGVVSPWQQHDIEINGMRKGNVRSSKIDQFPAPNADSKSTTMAPANPKIHFDDGELTPDNATFSLNRRGTGGSSITSHNSSPEERDKYFLGSTSSKSPLRRSLSEEGLVPSQPNDHTRRERSSDRNTASR
ncbi:hypothetical protein L211DRAFT_661070 [Terfezia boudieri ATCC MYA-4762]|uniref:Rhodopsin domain-containing protein n=1 Tax=Terfezia boudieri ATCC MYA-4762 TaxID=1051890 RepID=A0A3N4LVH6_9PEZI|nr:hypothetical protein L211DRAFT_661070 [Terfezia boudieri ATCC MYA-4762]